jgi:hypothetical protein
MSPRNSALIGLRRRLSSSLSLNSWNSRSCALTCGAAGSAGTTGTGSAAATGAIGSAGVVAHAASASSEAVCSTAVR